MFTIPQNTADTPRKEVIEKITEAFFRDKHLSWSMTAVYMDEAGGFNSSTEFGSTREKNAGRPRTEFTIAERDAAFEEFRKKGYHIKLTRWCAPNGRALFDYSLHPFIDCDPCWERSWIF